MIWLINLSGLGLVALIVWWFWLYRPSPIAATSFMTGDQGLTVLVRDGTYQPAQIQLPAGKPTTLTFIREDATPCAEMVLFGTLNISQELPLGERIEVTLPALSAGRYPFTCQMQMYRGEVVAVSEADP
ncbi:MAG: cupredoxin domain-containing protein [Gammaproteobacteria bacterium]